MNARDLPADGPCVVCGRPVLVRVHSWALGERLGAIRHAACEEIAGAIAARGFGAACDGTD